MADKVPLWQALLIVIFLGVFALLIGADTTAVIIADAGLIAGLLFGWRMWSVR